MPKIRHIAYRAEDVDGMANFFVNALGMTIKQKRKNNAIDLSDGTINITVLPLRVGTPDGEAKRPMMSYAHARNLQARVAPRSDRSRDRLDRRRHLRRRPRVTARPAAAICYASRCRQAAG